MVPEGWDLKTIGEVADVKGGKRLPKGYQLTAENTGFPYIRVTDMFDGGVDVASIKYVPEEIAPKISRYRIEKDDIFITVAGTLGLIGEVPEELGGANLTENADRLTNIKCNKRFLLEVLRSPIVQKPIDEEKTQNAQPKLALTRIKGFLVPIPPPRTKKIAQILSTWDQAITATEHLLENSQQGKKGLMQQLLTGKKRLPGFEGKWEEVRLRELLTEVKARNKDLSISRVLTVTNHSGFVLPEDHFAKRVASDNVSNYRVVRKGQYGYNPSRLNIGSFARLDSYDEGLLSPMYVVFSVYESRLNNDYFLNWMKSNEAKQRIAGSTQGSVRDSVGFDALCTFPFRLPPLDEQRKIAEILNFADREIIALKERLDLLQQEKKALMQQLLTGKRRVNVGTEAA
ncbi:restriction endonuclease subunit S [Halomonas sp. TBZ9]|uniref:Restriction endonuclease subunit S n=1 Tax=Vreelandella azerica TaxID=2732867 RepID=A0A7Y3TZD0_9GAMM|nr:restriction endonuclease subunit S [Halomonas azerica]NOG32838.1 restriction endonuclease subunit S [Halomonas azerica]